jgi:hypothetical protein
MRHCFHTGKQESPVTRLFPALDSRRGEIRRGHWGIAEHPSGSFHDFSATMDEPRY